MAYLKKLFNDNFLFYASYVIKDRAIPDLEDGLKPVQRRILHSLFEMDDGKFHKVANVIGHCMKYHPHGDASIGSALVVLANKELFIDKQGNFGNIFTGDEASAARYIECKASAFAKEILYNPKTTDYVDSYDGRNREPSHFPAKLPLVLLMGAEGIAVGMSTKILPHNPVEVIKAEIACLQGRKFQVFPDFPTGGSLDLSDYQDGNGKVRVRAKLDISDPKKIVIREIPFSSTTESLIASVEAASRTGQLKISSISDFTTEKVEIEIRLQRGVYTQEVIDALYAFTECEQSISCNSLVIRDDKPVVVGSSEMIRHHSEKLLGILRRELEIEKGELLDEIHARTLERIFIEERIYKSIENKKTQETVIKAVFDGLKPFAKEIGRAVTQEDIERLLKIPIRRISLYDIEKARDEMRRLDERLAEVEKKLADLVGYAVDFLKGIAKKLEAAWPRRTVIERFSKVDAREAARRDVALRYDASTGYLGTAVTSGDKLFEVSAFDRILVVRRTGLYSVVDVPEKLFVDKGLLWVAMADKEEIASTLLTIVYRESESGCPYIKRCSIETWILGKDYSLVPEGAQLLLFSTEKDFEFNLNYAPKPRMRKNAESFRAKNYQKKGIKAAGVRLATRDVLSADSLGKKMSPVGPIEPELGLDAPAIETSSRTDPAAQAAQPEATTQGRNTYLISPAAPERKVMKTAKVEKGKKNTTTKAKAPVAKAEKKAVVKEARPTTRKTTKKVESSPKKAEPVPPPARKMPVEVPAETRHEGLLAALARKKAELEAKKQPEDDGATPKKK